MQQDIQKDHDFLVELRGRLEKGFCGDTVQQEYALDMVDHWIKELADLMAAPNKPVELDEAVKLLIQSIQEYESDTWSSPENEVDEDCAKKMAAHLIYQKLFDQEGCPMDVDGPTLGYAYDAVTENEFDE